MSEMSMEPRRETDATSFHVTRTVPLWALVSMILAAAAQGVSTYYGQIRLSEKMVEQSAAIEKLSASLSGFGLDMGKANMKGVETEFRLGDLDRRLQTIERARGQRP